MNTGLTVKAPNAKTPIRTSLRFNANCDFKKRGMGKAMIIMSDEMLTIALVIMWLVSAEQLTVLYSVSNHSNDISS